MRRGQQFSRLAVSLVLGALAAPVRGGAEVPAPNQASAQPLRVCADPDDLPFSSAKSATPGLYIELGQQIARALGRPLEPVWTLSYFGKRTVRTTLLAKACDAYVGLPGNGFMGPQLIFSKPFLHAGFAIMASPGDHITRLSDLSGKRVAVQFSTPPQIVLANRDDVHGVTFLSPGEAALALSRHEVDVAFIWGPTAGYINITVLHGAYQVTPVAGEGMQYPVTIGFNKADAPLRDQVDRAIDGSAAAIGGLVAKYGLPTAAPMDLASLNDPPPPMIVLASTSEPEPQAADAPHADAQPPPPQPEPPPADAPHADAPPPQPAAAPEIVADGRKIFNSTCSHCHGPDGAQSVKKIDLRLLRHRYGGGMEQVYHETVIHGRPAKGMPNWSKVFSEDDFKKIFVYLNTIQTD
jgi:polar amino acid transport system substrate-binding protein